MPLTVTIGQRSTVTLSSALHIDAPDEAGTISLSIGAAVGMSVRFRQGKRMALAVGTVSSVDVDMHAASNSIFTASIDAEVTVTTDLVKGSRLPLSIGGESSVAIAGVTYGKRIVADIEAELGVSVAQVMQGRRIVTSIGGEAGVSVDLRKGTRITALTIEAEVGSTVDLVAGGTPSPYLIHDTFSAASGDIKDRPMDVGPGWTRLSGLFSDATNKAVATNATETIYVSDCGESDRVTTATINLGGLNFGIGFISRYSDATHFWLFYIGTVGITLYENNGGYTSRASLTHALGASTDYEAVVTCNGTSISILIDGVTVSYSSSFNQTATGVGLFGDYGNAGQQVKNYRVEAIP